MGSGHALGHVLWIGGSQWSGKTSVARLLAERRGLQPYHYDYQDARGHSDKARAHATEYPELHRVLGMTADQAWVLRSPEEMAQSMLRIFDERFHMVAEDLAALPAGPPVLVEGWGIRPRLVAPLLDDPHQAIFLVATEGFRLRQLQVLPRAQRLSAATSDPVRGQANRLERDRLLGLDVAESARHLGLRLVMVDGSRTVEGVADLVESHFGAALS